MCISECSYKQPSLYYNGFDQAAKGLSKRSDVDLFFSSEWSTLRKIPSFLSLHQPRTSHEYYLCILAMFTISREYIKHWPSLKVLSLRVCKCETRRESAVKLWFPDDIVTKLATSLTMWYIWDHTHLSWYELRTYCHRLRLVNLKKNYR